MKQTVPQRPDIAPRVDNIKPMLLSEGPPVPDGPEWLHQIKYDGFRALAQWERGQALLRSRNGANASDWFAEVTRSLATLDHGRCVVDGEVCVLDEVGRSDFDRLMRRARQRGFRKGSDSVVYCVFDVLVHNGRSVMDQPLTARLALLPELLRASPDSVLAMSATMKGEWLYRNAVALQIEGIVSKRVSSVYRPGVRSPDWIKRKRPGATPAQRFSRGPVTV